MGFKSPDVNGPVDKTIGFKKTRNGETILMNFPKPKNTLISYAHDCKIFHLSPNSSSLRLTQPLLHPVADLLLLRRCSSLTPAFFFQPISSIRSPSSPSSPSKVVLSLDPLSPISLFSPSRSDPSSLQIFVSGVKQEIDCEEMLEISDVYGAWPVADNEWSFSSVEDFSVSSWSVVAEEGSNTASAAVVAGHVDAFKPLAQVSSKTVPKFPFAASQLVHS